MGLALDVCGRGRPYVTLELRIENHKVRVRGVNPRNLNLGKLVFRRIHAQDLARIYVFVSIVSRRVGHTYGSDVNNTSTC